MLVLHGSGVGKGIAIGTAFVLHGPSLDIPEYTIPAQEVEPEVKRFRNAVVASRQQLREIAAQIPANAPSESASFIETYLLMLQDPEIAEKPIRTIREQRLNAEHALRMHGAALMRVFEQMEDAYLRSKRTDVEDVINRVQRNLLNIHRERLTDIGKSLDGKVVVTRDLSPADAVLLKRHKMSAFATDLGGPISHTAILARSLNIPAIVGMHGASRYIRNGETVVVDGKRGVVMVAPDSLVLDFYEQRRAYVIGKQLELEKIKESAAVTRDGATITLMANIELPDDIKAAQESHADSVGLYRTEYLFMNRAQPPSEAEQFAAYTRVIKTLRQQVTIRTLDLGADKQVDGGRGEAPTNPALGLRAVRMCLHDPALFKPQLRAILRASAVGPVQMMIPMVSSLDELDQVKSLIEEVKHELDREGHTYDANIPVGGMIEVPAAAVAADLFAQHLDFLSIGTNDLIQYTLAIDRVDDAVNYLYDPLHPAVLRLIKLVIDAANKAGIPVTMCGEMAGDPRYTRLLMGLGLRLFSMDPSTLLEVKRKVMDTNLNAVRLATENILRCHKSQELKELVGKLEFA